MLTYNLQFTRNEQLVNFRGIQNRWRRDDVIRTNLQAHIHVHVHVRLRNLSTVTQNSTP